MPKPVIEERGLDMARREQRRESADATLRDAENRGFTPSARGVEPRGVCAPVTETQTQTVLLYVLPDTMKTASNVICGSGTRVVLNFNLKPEVPVRVGS